MNAPAPELIGLPPLLPWPLSRWRWWTEPVPAERLAAFRIGLAAVLLLDLLMTLLPWAADFFGPGGLEANVRASPPPWPWSLAAESPSAARVFLLFWLVSAGLLLVGLASRGAAAVAWLLTISFNHFHPTLTNAGDVVCAVGLLYLTLSPCGAAWSLDAWLRGRRAPAVVPPWPLRLLFVQMVLMYFCNGLHKLAGVEWRSGEALYLVLADLSLSRWSYAQLPLPYPLTRLLTWTVLVWELGFPLLVCWKWTRRLALGFGVAFHLALLATVELGCFPLYALCLYLPLVPWERVGPTRVRNQEPPQC
jgi:hypothetical protein